MERDIKKMWIRRSLIGAVVGVMVCVLVAWLTQPGSIWGGPSGLDFTFYYDSRLPEALGTVLSLGLWALFGAEVGVATIPFADDGRELIVRSLIHYAVTSATVCLWAGLNLCDRFADYLTFLVPLTLVYLLVWLGRWIGWYVEIAAIRERLGLAPKISPLKWRETLPYFGYAFLLCLVLPLILRAFDAPDVLILSAMYAWLLLPIGGFMSGLSLGKRQGVCPLYPVACAAFILVFLPLARLFSSVDDWPLVPVAFVAALLGNLAGAVYTVKRRKGRRAA